VCRGCSPGAPAHLLAQTLAALQRLAAATSSWRGSVAAQELRTVLDSLVAEVAKAQRAAGDGSTASAGR
jgi:hypothetical protein